MDEISVPPTCYFHHLLILLLLAIYLNTFHEMKALHLSIDSRSPLTVPETISKYIGVSSKYHRK